MTGVFVLEQERHREEKAVLRHRYSQRDDPM